MKALILTLAACTTLGGCAALNRLDSEVSAFSLWPAERKPTTYAFERLPSQQSQPAQQERLEQLARPAVEAAGFTPAPDRASADVTVQLGARITATERSPFDDPFWFGGLHRPYPFARPGRPWFGPGWRYGGFGPRLGDYGYEREVGVLIRDRRTGEPLYEARATNDGGFSPMVETALPAMFEAALKDFPNAGPKPHRVSIPVKS
jgi:hypothetical protein